MRQICGHKCAKTIAQETLKGPVLGTSIGPELQHKLESVTILTTLHHSTTHNWLWLP